MTDFITVAAAGVTRIAALLRNRARAAVSVHSVREIAAVVEREYFDPEVATATAGHSPVQIERWRVCRIGPALDGVSENLRLALRMMRSSGQLQCTMPHDSRLLGTWRSDARRTAREISMRRDIGHRSRRTLLPLFGKLELRFTRTRCYSTLARRTEVTLYTVLAKDESSVAILSQGTAASPTIQHLHFDGGHFWVSVGSGLFREFFRKIPRQRVEAGNRSRRRAIVA